ncbi:hypothetical protein FQ185_06920 [Pseudomonas sp. ANT_H12B]|nr:hypothetical protein FQ185_06920 [Pseudomonas sp. ANT_H12B]
MGHHFQHYCRLSFRYREQARSHIGIWCTSICETLQIYCGSEPARDSGLTVSINVECDDLIASRLAPTLGIGCFKYPVSA